MLLLFGDTEMPRVNYNAEAERHQLENELIRFAERIRERWPLVASIIYGTEIAVKMGVQYDAAQVMARFSKTLLDESRKEKIEPELQVIQLLILRGNNVDADVVAMEDTNK